MPNLKDIKNQISSVGSTKKITSAMKMVAASKLRRSQEKAEAARPYSSRLEEMLSSLASSGASGEGVITLHIKDRLDNSIKNLRWVTSSGNNRNVKSRGKSKYLGVSWDKGHNKFKAQIRINGKQIHIGRYKTENEAHEVFKQKFIEIYGFEPCSR